MAGSQGKVTGEKQEEEPVNLDEEADSELSDLDEIVKTSPKRKTKSREKRPAEFSTVKSSPSKPGPSVTTKRVKMENLQAKFTVTSWTTFLLKKVYKHVLAQTDWKKASQILIIILFYKIRSLQTSSLRELVKYILPLSLKAYHNDFYLHLSFVSCQLTSGEENGEEARNETTNQQRFHARITGVSAFPTGASVMDVMELSMKDILTLWAPIRRDIAPSYINEPDDQLDNWYRNLEAFSYTCIALMASQILYWKEQQPPYEDSRIVCLRETSDADTEIDWPKVIIKEYESTLSPWETNLNYYAVVIAPSDFPETVGVRVSEGFLKALEQEREEEDHEMSMLVSELCHGKDMWNGSRLPGQWCICVPCLPPGQSARVRRHQGTTLAAGVARVHQQTRSLRQALWALQAPRALGRQTASPEKQRSVPGAFWRMAFRPGEH
ncbi:hypothetical protein DFP73DRAFT_600781 [Morchella snyderi]|nr:hypothetical protein DFP73DRAFT_600781 [Morchella snyderi]